MQLIKSAGHDNIKRQRTGPQLCVFFCFFLIHDIQTEQARRPFEIELSKSRVPVGGGRGGLVVGKDELRQLRSSAAVPADRQQMLKHPHPPDEPSRCLNAGGYLL